MSFTYSLPFENEKLLDGILFELKRRKEYELSQLLRGSRISIEEGGYSYYAGGGRHNAHAAYVTLYVNPMNIDILEDDTTKKLLTSICDTLIPAEVGFDVKSVSFSIDLTKDYELEDDLIIDLEKQSDRISGKILAKILPQDVKEKGYYMSEIYTYLYAVENSLRLFIEDVFKTKYGEDYFEKVTVPSALKRTLEQRINDAESKKWLSVRGESKLFYLDFKDLGTLISNNWDVFKDAFPSQEFILSKINEMADCRNLIAHNSLVNETERNVIKTYYNVILKQISQFLDS
ncbi:Swt1 family HEPN domain-containing protein [Ammoniphilus resinae]|uniref:Swt1-like HEPN domain-containing protein n=1 Tax=Ammoniphilus resinae TaxID=861532 RepID=A0ABS4GP75_9BACL|nr:Swt1 family HEPN domain-containing protein [Ammoniphilus resinae]MBP1932026.1 hypothetical protein [Ammoniphilus resinae]